MKRISRFVFSLISLAIFSSSLLAAPSAALWERWTQHDANATQTIDHSRWDSLLSRYVVPHSSNINRVVYNAFNKNDRQVLKQYIRALSQVKISAYNRNEQRAYWINLYNALTIAEVLDHYPVYSIRDIKSGVFTSGPWKKKLISVEDKKLSLDDIEHRILRPIWKDPRLHYAVNCASIGCPNLQNLAYTANNSESLLEKGAYEFVNHGRAAKVSSTGKLRVSSLYKWFGEDFGGEAGVIAHLKQYAEADLANDLRQVNSIYGDHYDWTLNSVVPVKNSVVPRIGS